MKLLTCLTAILLLTSPGTAADFDKGLVADQRGNYATALREFRPLAEQCDSKTKKAGRNRPFDLMTKDLLTNCQDL
jgi:hypothetical protein